MSLLTLRQERDEAAGYVAGIKSARDAMKTLPEHILDEPEIQVLMEAMIATMDKSREIGEQKQYEMETIARDIQKGWRNG